jgi:hypothetical protein
MEVRGRAPPVFCGGVTDLLPPTQIVQSDSQTRFFWAIFDHLCANRGELVGRLFALEHLSDRKSDENLPIYK